MTPLESSRPHSPATGAREDVEPDEGVVQEHMADCRDRVDKWHLPRVRTRPVARPSASGSSAATSSMKRWRLFFVFGLTTLRRALSSSSPECRSASF